VPAACPMERAQESGLVAIQLVFEAHAMTVDNEQGHATGASTKRNTPRA
jgi:hypothetical protein